MLASVLSGKVERKGGEEVQEEDRPVLPHDLEDAERVELVETVEVDGDLEVGETVLDVERGQRHGNF